MYGLNWRAKKACAPNKWGGGQTGIMGGQLQKIFGREIFRPQFFIVCSTPGKNCYC